jgi:hypothetical protein
MNGKLAVLTIGIIGMAVLLPTGCRTHNVVAEPSGLTMSTAEAAFTAIRKQAINYQTFSARLQIELIQSGNSSLRSRADLKIIRNQKIQISIQPLAGIEIARIEISRDSIKMLDRMNKQYLMDTLANIEANMHLPVNFYNLQALLTNQLFLPNEDPDNWPGYASERFVSEQTVQGFTLLTQQDGIRYQFAISDRLDATEITDRHQNGLLMNYMHFGTVGTTIFPMEINTEWRENSIPKGKATILYSNINIDKPVEITFSVPQSYKRVGLSQIMKTTERI